MGLSRGSLHSERVSDRHSRNLRVLLCNLGAESALICHVLLQA